MIQSKAKLTALTAGLAALMISTAGATTPLVVSGGYNQDVIANGSDSAADSTTATLDGFSVFFDSSFATDHSFSGGAFPAGETVTGSTSGAEYTLPSAGGDNALLLAASDDVYPNGAAGSATSGTLTFAPTSGVQTLYVLGTSTNGFSTLDYQLNFAGGVTYTGNFTYQDWGTNSPGADFNVGRTSTTNPGAYDASGLSVYEDAISVPVVDQSLTLDSVTFTYASGAGSASTAAVFGLSAVVAPEPSTVALLVAGCAGLLFLARRRQLAS